MSYEAVMDGLWMILDWGPLAMLAAGILIGILVGSMPGLTATMAIAILVPLSYHLPALLGIPLLIGIYKGGLYGGAIPAILISTPGTGGAAATIFDGYPLAQQGKARKALQMSLVASTAGDAISDVVLFVFMAPLAMVALLFGAPEYFGLFVFSLVIIAGVTGDSFLKGVFAAFLGLLVSTIGIDSVSGSSRFTFGNLNFAAGINFMTMLIGLFAVSEVLIQSEKAFRDRGRTSADLLGGAHEGNSLSWREAWGMRRVIAQSSVIGTFIGVIPGLGAPIAAFLAYTFAKRTSRNPEQFGKGSLEGVAAPESANNAVNGANFLPLFAFGIPGDIIAAVMLGAFVAQGMRPGPDLFTQHAATMYALLWGMIIANAMLLLFAWFLTSLYAKVVLIPKRILFPAILAIAAVGSYSLNNNLFDVKAMIVFGIIGFGMKKFDIPFAPMIITALLARSVENSLVQSYIVLEGNLMNFMSHPVAMIFFVLTGIVLLAAAISVKRGKVGGES